MRRDVSEFTRGSPVWFVGEFEAIAAGPEGKEDYPVILLALYPPGGDYPVSVVAMPLSVAASLAEGIKKVVERAAASVGIRYEDLVSELEEVV